MSGAEPFVSSEVAPLGEALLVRPRDAFGDPGSGAARWQEFGWLAPPDPEAAEREHEALVGLLEAWGVRVRCADPAGAGLDAIYARDASVMTGRGAVLCRMGKEARAAEPESHAAAYAELGIPVLGRISAEASGGGRLEGGDVVWLERGTLAVGRGYRTDDAGIRRLRTLAGDAVVDLVVVPLPHWRGPDDVFHLMSVLSPIDEDLLLVYSPLLPVPFRERLLRSGFELVEVPDEEFESLGANVLAVGPRRCLALEGNARTRRRLEAAGAEVRTFRGEEICRKGQGGPTCLVRPLRRAAPSGGPGPDSA